MNPQVDSELYDRDFFEWVRHNADLLRKGCVQQADMEHIAEELEDLGKRDQRTVENRLEVLLMHLLKWKYQPARRYSPSGYSSWLRIIREQRRRLHQILKQSPSLKRIAYSAIPEMYPYAAENAADETRIPLKEFPKECPFTLEQILDRAYLPE